jgi:succinate dehydrogenase/fumarate reductase flavoprotein subunit
MMEETSVNVKGAAFRAYRFSALVAGTGAAGFNAADTLFSEGVRDFAMVTEHLKAGTSRNTGSDKQTYYKLSLAGDDADSVRKLAEALYSGQCMDGDIALCEAASSVSCFIKLALLGVPFPHNRYGEYSGYKTDHDPARRATSAGPYTSKYMTEALEAQVKARGVRIFEGMQIIRLLVEDGKAAGLVCLDLENQEDPKRRFVVFLSPRIVLATGGPAAMYGERVYPESQNGAAGAALEAGAMGRNLTEWQYGLASLKPKWNVSGSYMQVLPRFVSTDGHGGDEQEFLKNYFPDLSSILSMVFLKGYQWPFDIRKLKGSSLVDLLVSIETSKGRRVYLDFRDNPGLLKQIDFDTLIPEAGDYLRAAGAAFGTPVERLEAMNSPALDFYKDRGVDLRREPLEIALCAQHNNGGLAVDWHWQSNIEGLFPVGEAAGTHGVYRPGGSALNAGQAGSLRAARFIAREIQRGKSSGESSDCIKTSGAVEDLIAGITGLAGAALSSGKDNARRLIEEAGQRMSRCGAAFRDGAQIREALETTKKLWNNFTESAGVSQAKDLFLLYRLRDILFSQYLYLSAMAGHIGQNGKSRGGALYYDPAGEKPLESLPERFRYVSEEGTPPIQEILYRNGAVSVSCREPRPIPETDEAFEKVWKDYREGRDI